MRFVVYGQPKGKQRPKFSNYGGFVRAYTPKETISYEKYVAYTFKECGGEISEKNLKVSVKAYFQIPKSTTKKLLTKMENDTYYHSKKPDADNILKIVLDGLNKIAYNDDNQIVEVSCMKFYSKEPRVEIEIEELGDVYEQT